MKIHKIKTFLDETVTDLDERTNQFLEELSTTRDRGGNYRYFIVSLLHSNSFTKAAIVIHYIDYGD